MYFLLDNIGAEIVLSLFLTSKNIISNIAATIKRLLY